MVISANLYYPYTADNLQALSDIATAQGYSFVGLDTCVGDQPGDIYQNATWAIGDGFCYTAQENCTTSPADCGACPTFSARESTSPLSALFSLSNLKSNYQVIAISVVIVVAGSTMVISVLARVASAFTRSIKK